MQSTPSPIFNRERNVALLVLALCEFVRGSLIFFILPTYVHHNLGFPAQAVGYAMAAHYVFDTGLRSPTGWLVDRIGQRRVCAMFLAIAGIGLWMILRAHVLLPIFTGCALLGVGMAAVWPAVISRVTTGLQSDGYATAMGGVMMVWLLGAGSGAICMSWLFGAHVERGFGVLMGMWTLAYLLALWMMQGPGHARRKRTVKLAFVLREVNHVKLLFPGVFVQTFAIGLLLPVLVLYVRDVLLLDGKMYSYLLLAGGAAAVFLQIPMGKLVDKFSYRPFLVFGFTLAAVTLPALLYWKNIVAVFVLIGLFGASYSLILPAWNSVVARSISARRRAAMFGIFLTVEGLGMAIGPIVGTVMWNVVGTSAPFDIASGILFTMGVLYGTIRLERLFISGRRSAESSG